MNNLKIIFMGTPIFSVEILKNLIKDYNVIGIVTQPDKKIGRNKTVSYPPVKDFALKNNIKVFQPIKIKTEFDEILKMNPDIIITCAYGQIIPKEMIDYPKYGCINVHASLLPKYRGGAPIQRAIMNGEDKTGITIMYMDETMDTGDMINKVEVEINTDDTYTTLHDKLKIAGSDLLLDTLPSIFNNTNKSEKQDNTKATYAPIIKKEDELINFNDLSINVYNKIRGLNNTPLGYIILNNNQYKILESKIGDEVNIKSSIISNIYKDGIGISTKDKEIIITKIKPNGKNEMSVKDFLNGYKNKEELIGCNVNE